MNKSNSNGNSRNEHLGLWANRKNILSVKTQLKDKIPKLSATEVRRVRIPYADAVIKELYEEGYQQSAKFMQQLIKLDKNVQHSVFSTNKDIITYISNELKLAETFQNTLLKEKDAIDILINLGNHISETSSYLWVAEQIFLLALGASQHYLSDGGLMVARTRYIYAKFLVEKCGLHKIAIDILNIAYNSALGKDWTIVPTDTELLIKYINLLLCVCYIEVLKDLRSTVPDDVRNLSKKTLKHALASENKPIICKAYLQCGIREVEMKKYLKALEFFTNSISIAQDLDLICERFFQKSNALHKLNEVDRAEVIAREMKKLAEENNRPLYIGKAHALLGEIAVTRGLMNVAAINFIQVVEKFSSLKNENLARQSRCLGAFAISHQIIGAYVKLIHKASTKEHRMKSLHKLMMWKEKHNPFWEESQVERLKWFSTDSQLTNNSEKNLFNNLDILSEDTRYDEI